jgi:hypothetical protein
MSVGRTAALLLQKVREKNNEWRGEDDTFLEPFILVSKEQFRSSFWKDGKK